MHRRRTDMLIKNFPIKTAGSGDNASLTVYILDGSTDYEHSVRPLVLICPGGGYEFVSAKEGEPMALQFTAMGYHAAILRYSVRPAVYPTQLLEAAAAWKIIREHAEEWNVQADKIIIEGGSAGGHLAASYGIFCGEDIITNSVGLSADELRPAGTILCYPVISSGEYAHRGSFEALLGKSYDELSGDPMLEKMSLEKQVTEKTPPAFIWHTFTDDLVPSENSFLYAMALKAKNVGCELHIFPDGGHGLALANEFTRDRGGYGIQPECQAWIPLVKTWLGNKFGYGGRL